MVRVLLFATLLASALAAPALVWKTSSTEGLHDAEAVNVRDLLSSHSQVVEESSLATVIFSLDRSDDGREALSAMTPKLSSVATKVPHSTHYHVWGVASRQSLAKDARNAIGEEGHVLELSLNQVSNKLANIKKDQVMRKTNTVIVYVSTNASPKDLDSAVIAAIENSSVKTVILTALRGTEEVKQDRTRRRLQQAEEQRGKRRRLDEENGDDGDDGNNDESSGGVYYVHMTPNILAGILFTLFFTVVSTVGLQCMGQIAYSDIYVSKMPIIGREA